MSGAQIGTVVGAVVGSFIPVVGTAMGATIGGMIGGAISPDVIKAPSIGDAQKQTSAAGVPRPVLFGHPAPFSGNIIDGETVARKITVKTRQGKGGGPIVKSERFLLTYAVRVCEGPIAGIVRIKRNGETVYDRRTDAEMPNFANATTAQRNGYIAEIRAKTAAFKGKIRIYLGDETQLPDPSLEAIHGVGNTPYYRGTCYFVVVDDDVTDTRGAASLWEIEALSSGTEAPLVTTITSVIPPPSNSISGGMIDTLTTDIHSFGGYTNIVKSIADWGWSVGLNAPARVVISSPTKGLISDSGWMGSTSYQADLDRILAAENRPDLIGAINPSTSGIAATYYPPMGETLTVTLYRCGPVSTGSWAHVKHYFPSPLLIPIGVTFTHTPELPGLLIGSDGKLYAPDFVTTADLNSITASATTLRSVVEAIASRCNVPVSKLDASALSTYIIPGFLIAQQFTGADAIRPTQQAYFYDLPEVDGKIRAIKRGGATVVAITDDDLLETGQDDERTRSQAVEYPLKVSVVTQDPDADYAAVPQTSGRDDPDFAGSSEVVIQLAIPLKSAPCAQIAHKMHKVLHSQAEGRLELALPESFSQYVPGDCIDYQSKRWLIEESRYSEGEVRWKAVYDRASNYGSTATGVAPTPPTLPHSGLKGPTVFTAMNLPSLRSADNTPGMYLAARGTFAGWDGAVITLSVDGGETFSPVMTISEPATMGSLTADATASGEPVQVVAPGAELESVSDARIAAKANAFAIVSGNVAEVGQFKVATLTTPDNYDLTSVSRGGLGTAAAVHAVGDRFVMLDGAVNFLPLDIGLAGKTLIFRAVTIGTVDVNNPTFSVVYNPQFTSQTIEPYTTATGEAYTTGAGAAYYRIT